MVESATVSVCLAVDKASGRKIAVILSVSSLVFDTYPLTRLADNAFGWIQQAIMLACIGESQSCMLHGRYPNVSISTTSSCNHRYVHMIRTILPSVTCTRFINVSPSRNTFGVIIQP